MGWASYVEDIRDRLIADLWRPLEEASALLSPSERSAQLEQRLSVLRNHLSGILTAIQDLLELATDPTVDALGAIQHELDEEKKRRNQLESDNRILQKSLKEAHAERRKAQAELRKERERRIEAERRAAKLDKDLNELVSKDRAAFSRLLDMYPPRGVKKP